MMLITLDEAKKQCYIDHNEDDDLLEIFIQSASSAVATYIKCDDLTVENMPIQAKYAVLAYVGLMYKNRDEDPDKYYEHGNLPNFITSILYPLRIPTVS